MPVSANAKYACLPPGKNNIHLSLIQKLKQNPRLFTVVTQTFDGTSLVISGWGTTSSGGSQSGPLKAAYITGMSNAV